MPSPSADLSRLEARARGELVRDPAYLIELDLTRGSERAGVHARIDFLGLRPGESTFVEAGLAEIRRITFNSRSLPLSQHDGQRIWLPPLEERNSLLVEGEAAYERGGLGLHLAVEPSDGGVIVYSDYEPYEAHRTFPCFDQPDLKGTFALEVLAPQDWTVVFVDEGRATPSSRGARKWRFPTTPRLSPYVLGIAAGRLHRIGTTRGRTPLGLYCAPGLKEFMDAEEVFDVTRRGLDFFERTFGVPYPFSKYDHVFCPEKENGAMESPGCITMSDRMVFRGRASAWLRQLRANYMLHEMAHMWFGDLVTMRWWDDLWLNESFATVMATLGVDRATDFRDSLLYFAASEKELARREDSRRTSHPVVGPIESVEAIRANFDPITYEKGAAVLRQLIAYLGEERFFQGLRDYLLGHRYGNAEMADLISALERASGRDLDSWCQAWLRSAGIDLIRLEAADTGERRLSEVSLSRSAAERFDPGRPHHLLVGSFDWSQGRLERVGSEEVELLGAREPVAGLAGRPRPALMLPNDQDLTYARIRLDAPSQRTAEEHLSAVVDPLARTLIWDQCWDRVRTLELPASRFAQMVIDHLGEEERATLVPVVLTDFVNAARRHAWPERRPLLEAAMSRVCWAQTERAQPGGDLQLAWLQGYLRTASGGEDRHRCRGFLRGRDLPEGIRLDTELTFALLHSLAARGWATPSDFAIARATDSSSHGQERLVAANAARPLASAKRAVFRRLGGPSVTVSQAMMLCASVGGIGHEELLLPYMPTLRAFLERCLERRGSEFVLQICIWLPRSLAPSPELLESCRRALAGPPLHPSLERFFHEVVEETELLLSARQLDRQHPTPGALTGEGAHQAKSAPRPRPRAAS